MADSKKPSTRVEQKKTVTIKEVSFGERGEPVDNSSEYEEDELTDMELTDLRIAFDIFDYDNAGYIDPRKLGTVMKSLGHNPTEAEIQDLISAIDDDDSGTINFSEFQKMMKPKLREPDKVEDFRECFKVFDRDGNGVVTLDDLDNIFSRLGKTFTRHEMTDMLKAADVDGDKRVTFDDFLTILKDP